MDSRLWDRLQDVAVRRSGDRLSARRQPDGSRRRPRSDDGARVRRGVLRDGRAWRRARSRTPTRTRMVGHYWLRAPELAPTPRSRRAIRATLTRILAFADGVHHGARPPRRGRAVHRRPDDRHRRLGAGAAVRRPTRWAGPRDRLVPALPRQHGSRRDGPRLRAGSARARARRSPIVDLEVRRHARDAQRDAGGRRGLRRIGLELGPARRRGARRRGAGSTSTPSSTDSSTRFPMWDWVGGRTSELSAVGLLPAALQGIDVTRDARRGRGDGSVDARRGRAQEPGGAARDGVARRGGGRGAKDMVILPYKDRLALFSRYLQQLVMESLGKETRPRRQRSSTRGSPSTATRARPTSTPTCSSCATGVPNFFATFIEVTKDRDGASHRGRARASRRATTCRACCRARAARCTRTAAASITITVPEVAPRTVGMLIALYERAVGLYATLVNVNAYHQPGVEAGKKAAGGVLELQRKLVAALEASGERRRDRRATRAAAARRRRDRVHDPRAPRREPRPRRRADAGQDTLRRRLPLGGIISAMPRAKKRPPAFQTFPPRREALLALPNVGPATALDLVRLGISSRKQLQKARPRTGCTRRCARSTAFATTRASSTCSRRSSRSSTARRPVRGGPTRRSGRRAAAAAHASPRRGTRWP